MAYLIYSTIESLCYSLMANSKQNTASEAEVIFNRASLALAKSQRLIESWLPPKTPEEIANTKTEEELEAEEREIFTVVPERFVVNGLRLHNLILLSTGIIRLGLGAPLPKDTDTLSGGRTTADEKLRRQMLGKELRKLGMQQNAQSRGPRKQGLPTHRDANGHIPPTPDQTSNSHIADEEDEEESRSSLVKSRRHEHRKIPVRQQDANSDDEDKETLKVSKSSHMLGKRHTGSYLDEVLAERANKRKRKKTG